MASTMLIELVQENGVTLELNLGAIGLQGPLGLQGPPGLSDQMFLDRTANGAIGGQRMVVGNPDGSVSYANNTNLLHLGKVLGMSDAAYLDGETVKIIREGLVEFVGWSFDVDLPIYLGINGLLTQTPAVTGFLQIVGFAESPTKLFVNLREPILL